MAEIVGLYQHPWIPEDYHFWNSEDGLRTCDIYYRYPETPNYGFMVKCVPDGMYYLRQVKYVEGVAHPRGDTYQYVDIEKMEHHIEKLYVKEDMQKVNEIYELGLSPDVELAPF
jgi:hypothetical protein